MKASDQRARSVAQRVANRARERRLTRADALTAYAMDRFLYRLGRSSHAREFFLKGGVLVANLVRAPHRFTRDIDLLRSHGPPDLDEMRERFREVASVVADDGLTFDPAGVRATLATRELDGYDGVRVNVRGTLAGTVVDLSIDIGFGDALEPAAERRRLASFLAEDPAAEVYAYEVGPVLAEKVETLFARFPLIEHRLKDLLDVVVLAQEETLDGAALLASFRATFERRGTAFEERILDELVEELRGRRWSERWAVMRREKAVAVTADVTEAVLAFDTFVRPILRAMRGGGPLGAWSPAQGWT